MTTYPVWRYHRSGASRLIQHPDHEPQGPDWGEKPFPVQAKEPELPECCRKLAEKFNAAWDRQKKEHAETLAQFDAQWEGKVAECAALQEQLDALTAAHADLKKLVTAAATAPEPEATAKTARKK